MSDRIIFGAKYDFDIAVQVIEIPIATNITKHNIEYTQHTVYKLFLKKPVYTKPDGRRQVGWEYEEQYSIRDPRFIPPVADDEFFKTLADVTKHLEERYGIQSTTTTRLGRDGQPHE